MSATRRQFIVGSATVLGSRLLPAERSVSNPAPYGAIPSPNQLAWHKLELYAFLHFGVNTFTGREWGYGDEDPKVFNPTNFNADAILTDLKRAGMKAVILTCKHHDGFCLWPTQTTEHCIRNSSWKNGKGDVVREISEAARRHGLKFGTYVSPWDRNNAYYGKPEYLSIYRQQVTELLSNYGPIFEVWFDGANGGDGYYGGAREKRSIGPDYYQWDKVVTLVHQLQPHAVIFGAGGDIRWVGNEKGIAGDPCWATFGRKIQSAQKDLHASENGGRFLLNHGLRNGTIWNPAECDVSIRPGWFYHASEDDKIRTPEELVDLYFESVGRGASLLLNLPPDRQGLIYPGDSAAAVAFHDQVEAIFRRNLAAEAVFKPSNVRQSSKRFAAHHLVDGDASTFWATDDDVRTPELVIEFGTAVQVRVIRLREAIALGQRIGAIAIDSWQDREWTTIASASSIGSCRLIRLDKPIQTDRLRMRITDSPVSIAISELGIY